MASNLIETIQKNLNYPTLHKIDPNIQETKDAVPRQSKEKLGQGAIPTVLTALYKFTRTDKGCKGVLTETDHADWLGVIFEGKERTAVDKVAHYAGVTPGQAEASMEEVADEAINTLKGLKNHDPEHIRTYMTSQRHNILVYLPAAMQMGDLLKDEALDDRTNKMEGPLSNLMHSIEGKLSKGDQSKYP
ncbi:MAG: hypothetical protein H7Y42_17675 [Chitinophagaceae bacterium]|nr:hypothetical protein [Chitinophagaceae bacterium]